MLLVYMDSMGEIVWWGGGGGVPSNGGMILKREDLKHFPDYDTIMTNIRTIFFGCYLFAYNIQVKTLFKKC